MSFNLSKILALLNHIGNRTCKNHSIKKYDFGTAESFYWGESISSFGLKPSDIYFNKYKNNYVLAAHSILLSEQYNNSFNLDAKLCSVKLKEYEKGNLKRGAMIIWQLIIMGQAGV
jgi:hypothetical protein